VLVTNGQMVQFMFSFAVSVPFVWMHMVGLRVNLKPQPLNPKP